MINIINKKTLLLIIILVIFTSNVSAGFISSNDDGLKNLFQIPGNSQNIEVSYAYGGFLFTSTGVHESPITVTVNKGALNSNPKSRKSFNEIEQGWHSKDGKIRTPITIQVTERTQLQLSWPPIYTDYEFIIELSETCVGCATGTTTRTQTGMSNGSWLNFSLLNGTTGTFAAADIAAASQNWANASQPYRTTINSLANRTSQEYVSVNITNATGTNNRTHIFLNGFGYNNLSGIEVYGSNGTRLNFTLFWNYSLGINQTVEMVINRTNNVTPNIYYGNTSQLNLSNMSRTFDVYGSDFNDKTCGRWSGGACSNGYLDVTSSINIPTDQYKNTSNTIWRWKFRGLGGGVTEGAIRFWHPDTGLGDTGMSVYEQGTVTRNLRNDASTILSGAVSMQNRWIDIKISNISTVWSMWEDGVLAGTVTSGVDDAAAYWVIQYSNSEMLFDDIAIYTNNFAQDGIWGAQETYSVGGSGDNTIYAIPQNHPISEVKTSSLGSITVNLTITAGTPIQNIQLFCSCSSFTATVTLGFTNNTETLSETATNGYLIINKTVQLGNDSTNVWINDTITATTFLNAPIKGLINVTSNNESGRVTTTNNVTINTSFPSIEANKNVTINYTIPYDIRAVLSQPSNQTISNGSTTTHSITITDSTYLNQTIIWDFENDGVNDSWGTSVNRVWNTPGNFTGRVYVDTLTTVAGSPDNQSRYFTTNVTGIIKLISPANESTVSNTVTLMWSESPNNAPYTYQIATDSGFIGVVTTGTGTVQSNMSVTTSVSLLEGTTYYWRAKNNTGAYSYWFTFNTSITPPVPGRLNITVFDETNWNSRIMNFYVQLYNSTFATNKSTTSGWVNFSSDEIWNGEYLVRVVSTGYASRSVLATSPTNVTMYIPSTGNTINTIAFYLMDYTTLYPWSTSVLSLRKNNSLMHSSYFDADAKVAVYLIQGNSYSITITNGNNIHNWGNYIPVASGNVEIVITDITVNATSTQPFNYNLSYTNNDITLSWMSNATLNNLNFTILRNNNVTHHQLITTIRTGQSASIITDSNSTYYVYVTAETSSGTYRKTQVINLRTGNLRAGCGLALGCIIGWGNDNNRFNLPLWMYNSSTVFIIWIVAGSFGALFASFGALLALVLILLFIFWGWLEGVNIGLSIIGTITIVAIIDYLKHRE